MILARLGRACRSRGVAQLEFVANLPLVLGLLSLVIWTGVVLFARSQQMIVASTRSLTATQATSDEPTGVKQPQGAVSASRTAMPARSHLAPLVFDSRPPLHVPPRFRVLGDERVGEILEPIAGLARPKLLPILVKP
jgi:hypothetical protein